MCPKTTLLPLWPRHVERLDIPGRMIWQYPPAYLQRERERERERDRETERVRARVSYWKMTKTLKTQRCITQRGWRPVCITCLSCKRQINNEGTSGCDIGLQSFWEQGRFYVKVKNRNAPAPQTGNPVSKNLFPSIQIFCYILMHTATSSCCPTILMVWHKNVTDQYSYLRCTDVYMCVLTAF